MARIPEKARSKGIRIDEEKLIKRILDDYKADKDARNVWKDEAAEAWENYYSVTTEDKTEPWFGCANYFVPATSIMCDALNAMIFSRFRLPKPFLSIKAVSEQGVEKAEKIGHFLNFQVREELKVPQEIDGWTLDALVEGVKVLMIHWDIDTKTIRHEREIDQPITEVNPATGLPETRFEKRKVFDTVEDKIERPVITVPDSEDILYPPILKDLQTASHVIRVVYKTWEDLLRGKDDGVYYNIDDELKDRLVKRFCDEKIIEKVRLKQIGVEDALDRKVIPVIEWYGAWNMGKGKRKEEVIVSLIDYAKDKKRRGTIISGPTYLTEKHRHGKRPFFFLRAMKHGAGKFQGQSIPQKIKQTQEELNAIHNQRLDYGTLRNIPWILVGGQIQPQTIKLQPGAVISLPGAEGAKMPNLQGNPVFEMQEEIGYFQYLERQLPVTDLRLGRSPSVVGPSATATGMTNLLRQSDIRLQPILANMEDGIREMTRHLYALDCQYLPPSKKFRVEGEEGQDLFLEIDNREELTGELDFIVDLGSEDAQMERQLAMMRFQMMSPHPLMQNPVAQYELLKDFAMNTGRTDIDKFIPKPPKELRRVPADPEDEHEKFMLGDYQSPLPQENHIYHLSRHSALANDERWLAQAPNIQQFLVFHINEHMLYMQREAQQQRQPGSGMSMALPGGAGQGGFPQQAQGGLQGGGQGGGQGPGQAQPPQVPDMGGQIPLG